MRSSPQKRNIRQTAPETLRVGIVKWGNDFQLSRPSILEERHLAERQDRRGRPCVRATVSWSLEHPCAGCRWRSWSVECTATTLSRGAPRWKRGWLLDSPLGSYFGVYRGPHHCALGFIGGHPVPSSTVNTSVSIERGGSLNVQEGAVLSVNEPVVSQGGSIKASNPFYCPPRCR